MEVKNLIPFLTEAGYMTSTLRSSFQVKIVIFD